MSLRKGYRLSSPQNSLFVATELQGEREIETLPKYQACLLHSDAAAMAALYKQK